MKRHYITFAVLAFFLSVSGHSLYANSTDISNEMKYAHLSSIYAKPSVSRVDFDKKAIEALKAITGRTEIGMNALCSDLGLDSLDFIDLTLYLMDAAGYNGEITDEQAEKLVESFTKGTVKEYLDTFWDIMNS